MIYTYDAYNRLATKKDAKTQLFAYTYDAYNRMTTVTVNGAFLRTFEYDTNLEDTTGFSQYTAGRLAAVRSAPVYSGLSMVEMYSYATPGTFGGSLPSKKRLQVQQGLKYTSGGVVMNTTGTLNFDACLHLYLGREGVERGLSDDLSYGRFAWQSGGGYGAFLHLHLRRDDAAGGIDGPDQHGAGEWRQLRSGEPAVGNDVFWSGGIARIQCAGTVDHVIVGQHYSMRNITIRRARTMAKRAWRRIWRVGSRWCISTIR